MATNTLPEMDFASHERETSGWGLPLRTWLAPLASLKITVVSFALAIFLIFAGTLAQIDHDIWQVMGEYFRTPIAWIPLQIFVPRSYELSGGFYFPGGFTIGSVMLVNLLAAHSMRFKVQARGTRLVGGLVIAALGILTGWMVVSSGSNKDGIEGQPLFTWLQLWELCKWGILALWITTLVALVKADRSRKLEQGVVLAALVALGGLATWLFYMGDAAALSGPSMRILWQLMKASLVGLVLLAGCVLLFRKRAGVVLLHAGVGLMMLNELIVYTLHTEGQMQIREGETVNYVQDIRSLELAVVDRSPTDVDDVVVVPQSVLLPHEESRTRSLLKEFGKAGDWLASRLLSEPAAIVQDDELPFDIEVVKFLPNTQLRQAKKDERNLADAGQGLSFVAELARSASGTDMGGGVDMSGAYVKFLDKQSGKSLGTHLLALYPMFDNERVKVGDKSYDVALRFKRDYKPYALNLIDVRFDKYMGTNTPKNYSSEVRLIDPSRHVDRKVKIWMNNPLRYAGETFYQSTFNVDPMSRKELTGLQVVANTGWMIPYVGCMIVVIGMLAHFSVSLVRFVRRLSSPATASRPVAGAEPDPYPNHHKATWLVPLAFVALGCLWFGRFATPQRTPVDKMQLDRFGELPLVYEGRMKPFDTLARNSLRVISDREYFRDTANKKKSAVEWLLDVVTDARDMENYRVVRIYNPEVLEIFDLSRREGYRYSIKELRTNLVEFEKQVDLAEKAPAHEQSVFQKKVLELNHRLRLFLVLHSAFEEPVIGKENPAQDLMKTAHRVREMMNHVPLPFALPPAEAGAEWEPYTLAILRATAMVMLREEPSAETVEFRSMLVAYANGDAEAFNEHLAKYGNLLERRESKQSRKSAAARGEVASLGLNQDKMDFEAFFNRCQPFFACQWSYCVAFVLAALAWLVWNKPLNRAALALILLTLVVHTLALVSRIYISGRPPVTNLYSSAVFIGWGSVVLGLVLEFLFGLGIGNVIASVAGFSTLIIADRLAGDGDTFTVLQAVLDTQFWLATHVVCITFGYATTYVAGLLGVIYVALGFFTRALHATLRRDLARMIYGVLCFAIFFSFWGTVLGGLWADDSWGRFWGWDPKENGALIIVLWNALVLHARWDGMVKDRGLAVLAIAGNIAVSWSWFGVNQLGAGLHSYGFTEGIALALTIFVVSQLALIAIGSLPKRAWRSYASS